MNMKRLLDTARRRPRDVAIVGLSCLLILLLCCTMIVRITYPFDLEWMEGAMVDHVHQVLEGKRLYGPPSLRFVPFIYPPVFTWLASSIALVLGPGYLALRLVSVAATAATMACIYCFVRREGAGWVESLMATGLYAGCYPLSGYYYDVGRVDASSVCFMLWAAFAVRFGRSVGSAMGAAALLIVAYHTKQTSILLALPLGAYLWWVERRRAFWFWGAWIALGLGTSVALDTVHQGWFGYYTHRVVGGHAIAWDQLLAVLRGEIVIPFALALGVACFPYLSRSAIGRKHARLYYALLTIGLLVIAGLGRIHTGGWINVLMPIHAGVAVVTGWGLFAAREHNESNPLILRFIYLLLGVQLIMMIWDPRPAIPTQADRQAGHAWLNHVRSIHGDVWTTHRGHLTFLAGKKRHAHMMAIQDVMRSTADFRGAKSRLAMEVNEALASDQFARMLMDNDDFWFMPSVQQHMVRDGDHWFSQPDVFWPRAGARLRPEIGYVPKR